MPSQIDTDDARRLHGNGAQFVEVLGKVEYDAEHLPGAIHIPLQRLDREAPESLDRSRPVVVYCWDYQ
ncbi:MAG: rhodanese-like domain-containing protein [Actinomycetota bacterium]|nr:rhodanese-like domain-containing protein [Actinomycetota bacterium]